MPFPRALTGARPRAAACLLLALAAGCSDKVGKRLPVEGRVLLGEKPLTGMSGMVVFIPDAEKGNKTEFRPTGAIDAEGKYRLATEGKPGAPAGWYKVTVTATPPGTGDREVVAPVVHARYAVEKTTTLSVEVVAAPADGAYDLKVSRN